MQYILISFLAGILTVLAPCVFSLLPVVLGGSLTGKNWIKPVTIIISLSLSIFIFTLILKASTVFISVSPDFWNYLSGGILIVFGVLTVFPGIWGWIDARLGLSAKSDGVLQRAAQKGSLVGDIAIGAALGPVFSSCSPTYAIIVATILPQNPAIGIINLLIYLLGLALALIAISLAGQTLIKKFKWAVNPNGWFKKTLGLIFILIGISIFSGFQTAFETFLLDHGFNVTQIEVNLLQGNQDLSFNTDNGELELNSALAYPAPEIRDVAGWINSPPLTMAGLKGKVVLVDFWTYSCINCIRTLPYTTAWYDKYKDKGLVIIGMHSPEFAFEKVYNNVQQAVNKYGIKYPVALDNNMANWSAFNNQYWPATYFIDKKGNVVHSHFGEGNYAENEKVIQYLLGDDTQATVTNPTSTFNPSQTPETYLGYERLENFMNTDEINLNQTINYTQQQNLRDYWSLQGKWLIGPEYITAKSDSSKLILTFSAKEVYLVMGATQKANIEIKIFDDNNAQISSQILEVSNYDLYTVAKLPQFVQNYRLEITTPQGVQMNAFTFGS